ncbi:hypothetical protein JCM8097_008017 [Rhodosporidiobolus ruineniae]
MSPSARCCVCGTESTTRCEACGKAGHTLLFCSRECQKLVWKYHKRVCGKKDFEQPLLTKAEAAEMKHFKDIAAHVWLGAPGRATLSNFLALNFGISTSDAVLSTIDLVTDGSLFPPSKASGIITICRLCNSSRKDHALSSGTALRTPWETLARVELNLSSAGSKLARAQWAPWRSILLHHLLVVQSLMVSTPRVNAPLNASAERQKNGWRAGWEMQSQLIAAQKVVERVLEEEVRAKSGAEEARRVKQALDDVYQLHYAEEVPVQ